MEAESRPRAGRVLQCAAEPIAEMAGGTGEALRNPGTGADVADEAPLRLGAVVVGAARPPGRDSELGPELLDFGFPETFERDTPLRGVLHDERVGWAAVIESEIVVIGLGSIVLLEGRDGGAGAKRNAVAPVRSEEGLDAWAFRRQTGLEDDAADHRAVKRDRAAESLRLGVTHLHGTDGGLPRRGERNPDLHLRGGEFRRVGGSFRIGGPVDAQASRKALRRRGLSPLGGSLVVDRARNDSPPRAAPPAALQTKPVLVTRKSRAWAWRRI